MLAHRHLREHIDRELVRLSAMLARTTRQSHHDLVESNLHRTRQLLAAADQLPLAEIPSLLAGLCFVIDDAASDPDFEDAERARHDARVLTALEESALRATM